jgi:hypothetical protein
MEIERVALLNMPLEETIGYFLPDREMDNEMRIIFIVVALPALCHFLRGRK